MCILYRVSDRKSCKIKHTIQGIIKIMLLQQLTHIANSVFLCFFYNINGNLIRKNFNKESTRRENIANMRSSSYNWCRPPRLTFYS